MIILKCEDDNIVTDGIIVRSGQCNRHGPDKKGGCHGHQGQAVGEKVKDGSHPTECF